MIKLKTNKVIVAAIIGIMITTSSSAYADPLSDRLQIQQQQFQQNSNTYDDIMNKIQQSQTNIQKMDEQINDILDQINDTELKINDTRKNIGNLENDITECEKQLETEKDSLNKRIKVLYENGTVSYLDVLLESKSFGDFISRIEMVSKLIQYDNDIMAGLKAKRDEITNKKKQLVQKNDELSQLQQQNQKKLADIKNIKDEQSRVIAELREQQNLYASRMSEYQDQINETLKQIKAMKESAKQQSNNKGNTVLASRNNSSPSGEAIVAFASDYLGVPYVWGGSTPVGFDCSGFTKYVFAHFSINLNRRASQQALQGVPVSRDNLQIGDLVFFGNPVYHVGIYVGNDCFIHAPSSGDVVKITPLKWMDYVGARRIR